MPITVLDMWKILYSLFASGLWRDSGDNCPGSRTGEPSPLLLMLLKETTTPPPKRRPPSSHVRFLKSQPMDAALFFPSVFLAHRC